MADRLMPHKQIAVCANMKPMLAYYGVISGLGINNQRPVQGMRVRDATHNIPYFSYEIVRIQHGIDDARRCE